MSSREYDDSEKSAELRCILPVVYPLPTGGGAQSMSTIFSLVAAGSWAKLYEADSVSAVPNPKMDW